MILSALVEHLGVSVGPVSYRLSGLQTDESIERGTGLGTRVGHTLIFGGAPMYAEVFV
jgi:hypothetical protein